jgi:hypothetical protein
MSRFTPLDTSISLDEDIRRLAADIDASMADFERRLETERMRQPRPEVGQKIQAPLPKLGAPAPAAPVPPPAAAPQPVVRTKAAPVAAPPAGGLLAELAVEVGAKGDEHAQHVVDERRLHEALDRVFRYFDVFCRHANTLAPSVGRIYRLDAQTAYADLRWQEAMVKSRRNSLAESALLDFVAFRVRLAAPAPVTVKVGWNALDAFKKDMHILDLRTAEGLDLDGVVEKGELVMHLAADFPVQITFGANYESGRIDVLSRNLDGFGIAAFTCTADDVTQDFLDDLGRFLLARSNSLPAALQRARCRAEL